MEKSKPFSEWLKQSDYDLKTAKAMLDAGRFIYCVFMCHLALEKILKAFVAIETKQLPPKTHDLIALIRALPG